MHPNTYIPRIIDRRLDELLSDLPAISLEGPRAVGKTETALRRARTVHRLDDDQQLELVLGDPSRLITGDPPVLIDEWQRYPTSWDLVRRHVDDRTKTSKFILTGSAAPSERPTHSGAGRIVTLRMHPLSLSERSLATPTVSLNELLSGERPQLTGACNVTLADYGTEIARSGFPGIRPFNPILRTDLLDSYLERVTDYDLNETNTGIRDRRALRRWLAAYGAATATATSFATVRNAAAEGSYEPPSQPTAAAYRRTLEQLWLIEELPAWLPTRNRLRRLASAPKHHLADPALALRCLGIDKSGLLEGQTTNHALPRDGTLLGAMFESLVALSVRVYAQAIRTRVYHLRTHGGEHEIDLIVERGDGRIVALEVKLSATIKDHDVRHLTWLNERLGDELLDAAIITTGKEAYRRRDGIGVIPAALLTA
ncbi:MAG: ATP-binding protein [Acidimicrobiia bacterium]|nr:ATP-binding protein [Acidimicrobiia bacterium]MYC57833.1 ATP-binding protein [Acidimicrobiia bacterium]MYG94450.1 ATP-binding protein [Acidimicrobiia bacterium]MYI30538.1 ATP-binding protein [Acidimicrobiia bacterium]